MDYNELVRKLRSHNGWVLNETLDEAADAIEKLEKDVEREKTYTQFWEDAAKTCKVQYEKMEKKMLDWQAVADEHWEAYQHWFHNYMNDVPKWIPVTERLPEKRKYVLVRYKNNDMAVACWFDGDEDILFWRAMTDEGWCADCDTDPTHWMPLPEPPKEET